MKKAVLLELERSADLTINELRSKKPQLAKLIVERLEQRAYRKAVRYFSRSSQKLRSLVDKIRRVPLDERSEKESLRSAALQALREAVKKGGDKDLEKELDALKKTTASVTRGARDDMTVGRALHLHERLELHPEFPRNKACRILRRELIVMH